MPNTSGQTISIWMTKAEIPQFAPLTADARADVGIVGAGIAGLTTAYRLTQEGRSVAVLEDKSVGGGARRAGPRRTWPTPWTTASPS